MVNELIKSIIYLLVGVSVLLCGMKLMSAGLKKCIGPGIRRFFKKTQNSPLTSLGIGTVVTAGIQSSDATNAMVIGFINAGVMTVYQGLCIMLGAYIGTTMTGIIASFSSLSISVYFLLFSFIGTVMMFFSKEKVKNIGEILCGFGLLFFGLAVMKDAFGNPDIANACQNLFQTINFGPILFLIGVVLAALVQSSSAVTSIVIAMVGSNALGLASGLFLVLGATLGTVTNTILSSLNGNVQGKRAAFIAFFLRFVTSVVMLIILCLAKEPIAKAMHVFAIEGSDELPIAMFTVFYNLIFMPALIPFLKPTIKRFEKWVKDKETNELTKAIHYIDDKLLNTPDIASMQVKKEILNMFDLAYKNYVLSIDKFTNGTTTNDEEIIDIENKVDYLNERITDYLIGLSSKVQASAERKIGTYFHVINDIERIGDHAYNFYEMYNEMKSKDLSFSDNVNDELKEFNNVIVEMFEISKQVFLDENRDSLNKLHILEEQTDDLKTKFSTNHYERIKSKKCTNELSPYFTSLMTELERIADHLNNIGYSIVNPVGDEE